MEDLFATFSQGGPLAGWVLAVILMGVIAFIYNESGRERRDHLQDIKDMSEKYNKTMTEWSEPIKLISKIWETLLQKGK